MGRAKKAGEKIDEGRYKKLSQGLKNAKTAERHAPWQRLYDKVFAEKKDQFIAEGMKPKKARRHAHLNAKRAVVDLSGTSEQHVMRTIITYE